LINNPKQEHSRECPCKKTPVLWQARGGKHMTAQINGNDFEDVETTELFCNKCKKQTEHHIEVAKTAEYFRITCLECNYQSIEK
jgi:Ethanolamine utilization protein EutJ (predicted chaperonin)